MKKILFLLFCLFTFNSITWSQAEYREGYIIKLSGDTLFGTIDYRGDMNMAKYCTYKNEEGEKTEYLPVEIQGYRFIDSKYFVSKKVDGRYYFMEFLVDGVVDVFYMRDEYAHDRYYIQSENDEELREIPYREEQKYINGKLYDSKSTRHVGFLKHYMPSDEKFAHRIDQVGSVNHRSMIKLAEDYHNAVCDDYSCVVYEKKLPILKTEYEVLGGMMHFLKDYTEFSEEYLNYTELGANIYMFIPRVNERVFVKLGYNILIYNDKVLDIMKNPFEVGYQIPFSPKVNLRISGGYTFYSNHIFRNLGAIARETANLRINDVLGMKTLTISTYFEHTTLSQAYLSKKEENKSRMRGIDYGFSLGIVF